MALKSDAQVPQVALSQVLPAALWPRGWRSAQEWPDLSDYNDPEVVWRMSKRYHAGLIISSPDAARVESMLESYAERFARDFLAVMPPRQSSAEM